MTRAAWVGWVVFLAALSLCRSASAQTKPLPDPTKGFHVIVCERASGVPNDIDFWVVLPSGRVFYDRKGIFYKQLTDGSVGYLYDLSDPSCRPKPSAAAPKPSATPIAKLPPKTEPPKTEPPAQKPAPQKAKPEPTREATLAKLKAEALEARHQRALEARKNRPPERRVTVSGEALAIAEEETKERSLLPKLKRSIEPQPMWTSACSGCGIVGPPIDERPAPLRICRSLPERLLSGLGFASTTSYTAVRAGILKSLIDYNTAPNGTAKETHRNKLRGLFKSVPTKLAQRVHETLGTKDELALFFRAVLAKDPLKKELLDILESKYVCTPAPVPAPLPHAAPEGVTLPAVTLTDEAAFDALHTLLRERIKTLVAAADLLSGTDTSEDQKNLKTATLPALDWLLKKAQEEKTDAFKETDAAKKAKGIKKAGDWTQGALLATQIVELNVNMVILTEWASMNGVIWGRMRTPHYDYANDPAILALTQAALNANNAQMAAALPAAIRVYQFHIVQIDNFTRVVVKNAALSRKVIQIADMAMIAISIYQVWKAPTIVGIGSPQPPTILGVLPGGVAVGSSVSLIGLANALEAIRKLIAIGALDGAIIAGVGQMGGGSDIALPELQRPTSLSVQTPNQAGNSAGSPGNAPTASGAAGKVNVAGQPWRVFEPGESACQNGCPEVAKAIQNAIGGTAKTFQSAAGPKGVLGGIKNSAGTFVNPAGSSARGWFSHTVVVKDGRVYDALTGPSGRSIADYKALWEYGDVINFGF